jgi:Cu/Ag efflux protein CusF
MKTGLLIPFLAAALGASASTAHAQPAASAPTAAAEAPQSEAVVRKVDVAAGKITLRHGPIANLDMPPMTMVFRVVPPTLLEGLKAGDKIRFSAEKIDGAYTVTAVEVVR